MVDLINVLRSCSVHAPSQREGNAQRVLAEVHRNVHKAEASALKLAFWGRVIDKATDTFTYILRFIIDCSFLLLKLILFTIPGDCCQPASRVHLASRAHGGHHRD